MKSTTKKLIGSLNRVNRIKLPFLLLIAFVLKSSSKRRLKIHYSKLKERGQAAIEFMMTYGWAILVVLLAISTLAYFGIVKGSILSPKSCIIGTGFACTEFKVDNVISDSLFIKVRNSIGSNANSIVFTARPVGQSADCFDDSPKNPTSILDGQEIQFSWDCQSINSSTPIGQKFKATLTFSYILGSQTLNHTLTGSVDAVVE